MEGKRNVIGVLRETKNCWERRTPLIPSDAQILISKGLKVVLQPSESRIFTDNEYLAVGAEINEDLSEASLILGVKEVLPRNFLQGRIYLFFSHTFKGQYYNMTMLDSMISKNISLVDIELLKGPDGARTVALGEFGGYAGAMDFMQGLGKYLLMKNIASPFLCQGFGYMYHDLDEIRKEISKIGDLIANNGLSEIILPMVFGILGTGRTSKGIQEILSILPHVFITPDELESFNPDSTSRFLIYIVVFPTCKLYARTTDGGFDREEYQIFPNLYESLFAKKYARFLSVIYNCLYYETKYPRVLTVEDIGRLDKLLGICDISCDLQGAIEICRKFTTPEEPFFLYSAKADRMYELSKAYVEGSILYQSNDFLPTELPFDASIRLSNKLLRYIEELCNGYYLEGLEKSGLSSDLVNAMYLYKGAIAEEYRFIDEIRKRTASSDLQMDDNLKRIRHVIKSCPELASDVDNSRSGQELTLESKHAIIRIAELISQT